jgi:hypothetical protein
LGQIVPLTYLTRAFGIANVLIGLGGMLGNFLGGASKELVGSFAPLYLCIAGLLLVQLLVVGLLPDTQRGG